jgi:hypothetical protein
MKLQFGIKSILLVTSIVGLSCGGVAAWNQVFGPNDTIRGFIWAFGVIPFTAPIWLPFVLIAFAIGRKSLTVKMVVLLAIAQVVGVVIAYLLRQYI